MRQLRAVVIVDHAVDLLGDKVRILSVALATLRIGRALRWIAGGLCLGRGGHKRRRCRWLALHTTRSVGLRVVIPALRLHHWVRLVEIGLLIGVWLERRRVDGAFRYLRQGRTNRLL